MDQETGEEIPKLLFKEDKNGQIVSYYVNKETGEEEMAVLSSPKKMFKIPSHYFVTDDEQRAVEKPSKHYYTTEYTACLIFLLPTLLCFNCPLFICALALLESMMHYKAHRCNNFIKSKKFIFQSPMHALTSQFCSACRYESCAEKCAEFTRQMSHTKNWCSVIS